MNLNVDVQVENFFKCDKTESYWHVCYERKRHKLDLVETKGLGTKSCFQKEKPFKSILVL